MHDSDKEQQLHTAVSQENLVSIVVPTRNEARNIVPLLQRLAAALAGNTIEVLFVDDSTDDTSQVIMRAALEFSFPVRVIARPPERRNGLSGAVVEGFQAAKGTWLCVMDADLQHPPEVLPVLLTRAQEADADLVVGSRKAGLFGPLGLSRKRAMTSQLLTLLARAWFPRLLKNVSDPLTGLFLVRRTAVDFTVLHPDGFKILLELLIRCPGLRVSEVHFDFASRHEGESKADFQEGMRFFRHLLRLRLTANQSFPRLVVVVLVSLVFDVAAFTLLQQFTHISWLVTAVFAAELIILLRFYATEQWVLGGSHPAVGWPGLGRFWISNQLSLLGVRLPLLYLCLSVWRWMAVPAIFLAILIEGVVRYILSEQWVFSRRGITMWQPGAYYYDIHGLLRLESQVLLPELAYFATTTSPSHVDLQIRVDRHGTPTMQPGAIAYSEYLSRFGFGIALMPGTTYTEIVISPMLAHSPFALYKSVLEPVLRWALVQRGYALVYGAAVAHREQAVLIVPERDQGKTEVILQAVTTGEYAFMADDFAILAADGRVFSFPKPVTVTPAVLRETAVTLRRRDRFRLWVRNVLYARVGREVGLRLSQWHWPVATLNIIWQRLWMPPKRQLDELVTAVTYADQANLAEVVILTEGVKSAAALSLSTAVDCINQRQQALQGFPPYTLLAAALNQTGTRPWYQDEQTIISHALHTCTAWRRGTQDNWLHLSPEEHPHQISDFALL